jgi:vitamin B12 transporter
LQPIKHYWCRRRLLLRKQLFGIHRKLSEKAWTLLQKQLSSLSLRIQKQKMRHFLIILSLAGFGAAQASNWQDTVMLKGVEKIEQLHTTEYNKKNINFVKLEANELRSIDYTLEFEPGIYFKRYGNGMLTSISYRGTNAAQSTFLWNDININSPVTGQMDASLFSLFPNALISLSPASASIGATINVNTDNYSSKKIDSRISYGYNSLQSHNVSLGASGNFKFFSFSTDFTSFNSRNRFMVSNPFELNSKSIQKNSDVSQLSFQQNLKFTLPKMNKLSLAFWWTKTERQLPSLNIKNPAYERQYDNNSRLILSYDGGKNGYVWQAKTSYLRDNFSYGNPQLEIKSDFTTNISRNIFRFEKGILKSNGKAGAAVQYDFESANSSNYTTSQTRHLALFKEFFGYEWKGIHANIELQQQLWNKKIIPAGNLLIGYKLKKQKNIFHASILGARTFRVPSLNDLYWKGNGNVNLKSETGWKYSATVAYENPYLQTSVTAFGQHVNNWILWQPSLSSNLWQPDNIKKVNGYGVEPQIKVGLLHGLKKKVFAYADVNYSYNKLINAASSSDFDQSKGKQIIYAPLHLANAALTVGAFGTAVSGVFSYTGETFTTSDNSESLAAFYLFDLHVSKTITFKSIEAKARFTLYNLANRDYKTIPMRAMPGRYFEFSVQINMFK